MVDNPKRPFNNASAPKDKNAHIRDKDNASPDLKPSFAKQPAPNLAPSGMMGIQRSAQPSFEPRQGEIALVSIVKSHPRPEMLTGGRFTDRKGHGFAVEISPYRSIAGIEGGKINQLEIQENGKIVAQYKNMEWTRIPDKEEHKQLVQRLQDQFGEPRRGFEPIVPKEKENDRGHER